MAVGGVEGSIGARARGTGKATFSPLSLVQSVSLRMDLFDRVQLAEIVRVCRQHTSLSAAGRALFTVSRAEKRSVNDADRLRKYLARFDLDWRGVAGEG